MSWENMKQRRLRTFLTTLSVVVGITAIIGLASLGEGFRVAVTERMERGFELNVLSVIPGSLFSGMRRERFTDANVGNISQISGVDLATPVMQVGNTTLYNNGKKVSAFVATAVNFTDFWKVFPDRLLFEEGALPEHFQNNTIIIGYRTTHPDETEVFAHPGDNVNVTMSVPQLFRMVPKNYTFNVVGTLTKSGAPGLTNFDYWVFIPLDTAREIYNTDESDLIFVRVNDPELSEEVARDIEDLFPPYQITVLVPITFIRQVNQILNMVQIFLTAIASISLLVAGIGIMNIMTVSVMERTREIGILKAIGAKNTTILIMFLSEAVLIGLIGSLIGVPTGYGISNLLSMILSQLMRHPTDTVFQTPEIQRAIIRPVFSLYWTIGAIIFGILICILFGLYPARKASKLDPVEALRYE